MSKTAKIIIALVVCFLLFVCAVVGFGLYWWSQHRGELLEAGRKHAEQGREFGKKADEQGCLDEAIVRYKGDRGFTGSISSRIFLRSCLEASRPTHGFCDQVPRQSEIIKSARWQLEQAEKAGINDQFGRQLFSQLQQHCESKASKPAQ